MKPVRVKTVVFRGYVCIYFSRQSKSFRVPTGTAFDGELNSYGLLPKSVKDADKKNQHITAVKARVESLLTEHPEASGAEVLALVKAPAVSEAKKEMLSEALRKATEKDLVEAFADILDDMKKGELLTKSQKRYSASTVKGYNSIYQLIKRFEKAHKELDLTLSKLDDKFYLKLVEHCYETEGYYDNFVGKVVKIVIHVLHYSLDKGYITTPINTKRWFAPVEEKDITVLSAAELKILHDMPLEARLDRSQKMLEETRDLFLFGCFTTLRVSDLLNIKEQDLVKKGNTLYLRKQIQKTKKPIMIMLAPMAVEIIERYKGKHYTVLPKISDVNYNLNLKLLAAQMKEYIIKNNIQGLENDWYGKVTVSRTKRGEQVRTSHEIEKLFSSHMQRRTGISFLVEQGLTAEEICSITGHAPGSREIFKYIKLNEKKVNDKFVNIWEKALA